MSDCLRTIRKAVIPAAGYGTRLRPLTSVIPKEMLPLGRKPAVEYVIEELQAAGLSDIILVVSPQKDGIRAYFGDSACDGRVRIEYVVQDPQCGLADSILQAEHAVGGEDFVVALGDTVIISEHPNTPLARLVSTFRSNPAGAAVTVERVPIPDAFRFGMVQPLGVVGQGAFEISGLVEKPRVEESPSDYAIGGRYVFTSEVFEWIRRTPPGAGGEQQITDSIRVGLSEGNRAWCAPILDGEKRYDIGSFSDYCEAFASMCMLDAQLRDSVLRATHGR